MVKYIHVTYIPQKYTNEYKINFKLKKKKKEKYDFNSRNFSAITRKIDKLG
jgi:N-acetylmuramoyl-L-alanine amidase CwlA